MLLRSVLTAAYFRVFLALYSRVRLGSLSVPEKKERIIVPVIIVLAFLIRHYFAVQERFYHFDINFFKTWSDLAFDSFSQLYKSGHYVDYPPFAMYFLGFFGGLREVFDFSYESMTYTYMMKSLGIAFDLALCVFIYLLARKKAGVSLAVLFAAAYAFNPAVILDSSVWGQVDSMLILPIVLTLWLLDENRPALAGVAYRVAVLTKPQALLVGPVLLYYMICEWDLKKLLKACISGVAAIIFLIIPFSDGYHLRWIVKLYINTMNSYKAFSVNGYNLWALLGLNKVSTEGSSFANVINYIVLAVSLPVYFISYRRDHVKGNVGTRLFTTSYLYILTVFCFCTMMHERYLFPAMGLALFACIYSGKKECFVMYLLATACSYTNVAAIFLDYEKVVIPEPLVRVLSLLTVMTFAVSFFLAVIMHSPSSEARAPDGEPLPNETV